MAFVVRADPEEPGQATLLVDRPTEFDAIETALELIRNGRTGVTIMGEDGRIYTHPEFFELLGEESLGYAWRDTPNLSV